MEIKSNSEYVVLLMDDTKKRYWLEGEPILFESDDLHAACWACEKYFRDNNKSVGVWQPRTQGWRTYYSVLDRKRDAKGRFI